MSKPTNHTEHPIENNVINSNNKSCHTFSFTLRLLYSINGIGRETMVTYKQGIKTLKISFHVYSTILIIRIGFTKNPNKAYVAILAHDKLTGEQPALKRK